jgi:predicted DNA-binding ribbon-helix-helix protein
MLKENGQQKSLILDTGKTTIALENEFWGVIEYMVLEDGHDNWRDWFTENVLPNWDGKRNLASHTRSIVVLWLVTNLEQCKATLDPSRDIKANMRRMVESMPRGSNLQ